MCSFQTLDPPQAVDILEESVTIVCEPSSLSGVLAYPFDSDIRGAALVAGPHPLMGGSLQNNVVRSVGRGLAAHGYVSLRFSYGGDGVSATSMQRFLQTGHAPEDPERAVEACAALRLLRSICPKPLMLAGYSFGAAVIDQLVHDAKPSRLVLIGPTLRQHQFDTIQQSTINKLIITGDNDFATPLELTHSWFAAAHEPKKLVTFAASEHFYRGCENQLVAEIIQWL